VASLISNVGSPPILASLAVMLTAFKMSAPEAWIWGAVYVFLGVLIPFLYVVCSVMRGQITDIHIRLREQRRRPLLITLICAGVGWLVLALGAAPVGMTTVAAALWLQVATILLVTLRWKISVHTAAAAGGATLIWTLLGSAMPFLLVVPLIAWSRIRLRHHTFPQTLAGALLGSIVFFVATSPAPIR
jgi:membrane-associated phospholipid phosphatase